MVGEEGDNQLRKLVTQHFPALTFWYGLSVGELLRLPRWIIHAYVRALPRLQASYELMLTRAAVYPHMKPSQQRAAQAKLRRTAGVRREGVRLPKAQYKTVLESMGIGVEDAG